MADDKGKVFDELNSGDEEGSLEKARAQESLNGPEAREEHFKQNILMDVDEHPERVETVDQSIKEQNLNDVAESNQERPLENVADDVSAAKRSARPSQQQQNDDEQIVSDQVNIQPPSDFEAELEEKETQIDSEENQNVAEQDDPSVSAFERLSVDQEIEEAILFTPDEDSSPSLVAVDDVIENVSYENAQILGHYKFDDNLVSDSVGSRNGAIVNGVTQSDEGVIGGSANFSSSTSQGQIEIKDLPITDAEDVTVSFWMNWDGVSNVMPVGFDAYDLWIVGDNIGFNTGQGDQYGVGGVNDLANGWHHITATFHNGDITQSKLFIDGEEQELSTVRGSSHNSSGANFNEGKLHLGGWDANSSYRFGGQLDEVRVYNGTLDESDVQQIYQAELNGFSDTTVFQEDQSHLIAADTLLANDQFDDSQAMITAVSGDVLNGDGEIVGSVAAEIAELKEQLIKFGDRVDRLHIRAPISGYVSNLSINTIRAVIEPSQVLMEVVPVDKELIVESKISTQDIGHVHVGQAAVIKVGKYDPQRFGVIEGEVDRISPSTYMDEENQPYYKAQIVLAKKYLGTQPEKYKLILGMTVTADILTGEKTVLNYLLKPVYRGFQNAFQER